MPCKHGVILSFTIYSFDIQKSIQLIGMMFDVVFPVIFHTIVCFCRWWQLPATMRNAKCPHYLWNGLTTTEDNIRRFQRLSLTNHMFLSEMANRQTNVRLETIFLRFFANYFVMSLRVHLKSIAFNVISNLGLFKITQFSNFISKVPNSRFKSLCNKMRHQ